MINMSYVDWTTQEKVYYEAGVDHCVIFLQDGRFAKWNGVVSINRSRSYEKFDSYFEGIRSSVFINTGGLDGTIVSVQHPKLLDEAAGDKSLFCGGIIDAQELIPFTLVYRTMLRDDFGNSSYVIHILYNVTIYKADDEFKTLNESPEAKINTWNFSSVPEEIDPHLLRPANEIKLYEKDTDPYLLDDILDRIYGTATTDPSIPTLIELYTELNDWSRMKITIDDETDIWAAESTVPGIISVSSGIITFDSPSIAIMDPDTFTIDTIPCDYYTRPLLTITELHDDIFQADCKDNNRMVVDDDIIYFIDMNISFETEYKYGIRDTTD